MYKKLSLLAVGCGLWLSASAWASTGEEVSSPSARIETAYAQTEQAEQPTARTFAELPAQVAAPETVLSPSLTEKQQRRIVRVESVLQKKQAHVEKRLAKKLGADFDGVAFEDVVVLAGAIVVILGIISIVFSPIRALVSIILGLAVFLIGKAYGGSLDAFF